MAKGLAVGFPARAAQLLVDQEPRVPLVEVEIVGSRGRGCGEAGAGSFRHDDPGRPSFDLEGELLHEPALLLGQLRPTLGLGLCRLSLLQAPREFRRLGPAFGRARLELGDPGLKGGALVGAVAGRHEGHGQASLAGHGGAQPDAETMAELDRLERLAPLTLVTMDRIVSGLAETMEEVDHIAGCRTIRLQPLQEGREVGRAREVDACPVRDQDGEPLGELPRLDKRGVGILDEIDLSMAAEPCQHLVYLAQMLEIHRLQTDRSTPENNSTTMGQGFLCRKESVRWRVATWSSERRMRP